MDYLKSLIREIPDFPKPGILFYDITTLLKDKSGLRGVIDGLAAHYRDAQVDLVLGIEARGFIFAPALAHALGAGSRVLIVDDLLATGGTAAAAARMVREAGGEIAGLAFVIELTFLNGRGKLAGYDVFSLLQYDK